MRCVGDTAGRLGSRGAGCTLPREHAPPPRPAAPSRRHEPPPGSRACARCWPGLSSSARSGRASSRSRSFRRSARRRLARVPSPGSDPRPSRWFDTAYADGGTPTWDIGHPQAAVRRLIDAGWFGPPGAAVLDAGCGTGEHALLLTERGHRVVGVDLAAEAIARAAAKARRGGLRRASSFTTPWTSQGSGARSTSPSTWGSSTRSPTTTARATWPAWRPRSGRAGAPHPVLERPQPVRRRPAPGHAPRAAVRVPGGRRLARRGDRRRDAGDPPPGRQRGGVAGTPQPGGLRGPPPRRPPSDGGSSRGASDLGRGAGPAAARGSSSQSRHSTSGWRAR